jgi:hypothetical protein
MSQTKPNNKVFTNRINDGHEHRFVKVQTYPRCCFCGKLQHAIINKDFEKYNKGKGVKV